MPLGKQIHKGNTDEEINLLFLNYNYKCKQT